MKLLCLDTSGPLLSLACVEDGRTQAAWEGPLPARRSEELLPRTASMFEKLGWEASQLAAVAVSRGPGSFTGLRVGLAFAKGLALDKVAVFSESTLRVWAQCLAPNLEELGRTQLGILLDARRGQVYRGHFALEQGLWVERQPQAMLDLDQARAGLETEGAALGGDLARAPWDLPWLARSRPLAQGLAELVWPRLEAWPSGEESALLQPDYLRRPEVEILWEKRRAKPA